MLTSRNVVALSAAVALCLHLTSGCTGGGCLVDCSPADDDFPHYPAIAGTGVGGRLVSTAGKGGTTYVGEVGGTNASGSAGTRARTGVMGGGTGGTAAHTGGTAALGGTSGAAGSEGGAPEGGASSGGAPEGGVGSGAGGEAGA